MAKTGLDVKNRLIRQMGDTSGAQFVDSDFLNWINDAQREISIANDILQKSGSANTTSGISQYALPVDCQKLRRVAYLGTALQLTTMEQITEMAPDHDQTSAQGYPSSTPIMYWIYAGQINLYPSPSSTDTNGLTIFYTRQPVDLTVTGNSIDLPDEYFNRIVEYCLAQAYELDTNYYQSGNKAAQFQQGIAALKGNADWEGETSYPSITYNQEYDTTSGIY